jgi:predicted pyridoxine 5'-phosphate oxidase superfamily flavin-nucleotide-binding protein
MRHIEGIVMRHRFQDIAFTTAVRAEQSRRGSRQMYRSAASVAEAEPETLTPVELAFIAERDSFYLATVSETGWPYVQHRGGPAGFVRPLDGTTIGWAEYVGNRQYVSAGNVTGDDRVAMIFMDYPHRRRLKILGRMRVFEPAERADLAAPLAVTGYRARIEGFVTIVVEASDWNCPQHIVPRFTADEVEAIIAPLQARIAELEQRTGSAPAPP